MISVGSVVQSSYNITPASWDNLDFYTNPQIASRFVVGPRGGSYFTQCDLLLVWGRVNCTSKLIFATGEGRYATDVNSYKFDSIPPGLPVPVYFTNAHQITSFARVKHGLRPDEWIQLSRAIQAAVSWSPLGRFMFSEPRIDRSCVVACVDADRCDVPSRCGPAHHFSYNRYDNIFGSGGLVDVVYSLSGAASQKVYDVFSVPAFDPFGVVSQDGVRVIFAPPWCALTIANPYCGSGDVSIISPNDYIYIRAVNGSIAALPAFCLQHMLSTNTSRSDNPAFVGATEQDEGNICISITRRGTVQDVIHRCRDDVQFYPTIADVYASLNMPLVVVGNVSVYMPVFGDVLPPDYYNFSTVRGELLSGSSSDSYCMVGAPSETTRVYGFFKRSCEVLLDIDRVCIPFHVAHRDFLSTIMDSFRSRISGLLDPILSSLRDLFSGLLSGLSDLFSRALGGILTAFGFEVYISVFICLFVLLFKHYDLIPSIVLVFLMLALFHLVSDGIRVLSSAYLPEGEILGW